MPAIRPTAEVAIRQFDVVGYDSDAQSGFVRHLALSSIDSVDHSPTSPLPVTHMGPPFSIEDEVPGGFHTIGVLPLSDGERMSINLFVTDLANEQKAQLEQLRRRITNGRLAKEYIEKAQYCIHPHKGNFVRSFGDGTVQLRQFSCVGFVLEAYSMAGIDLINLEGPGLPPVSLDSLCLAYPDYEGFLRMEAGRKSKGLEGDGPWPIALAGYVMNALSMTDPMYDNPRKNLPYTPVAGDEFFPRR